ncbi:universal stress protein [Thiorhodococcus mannitoliphagus]|uniref:Universal stress protein n=1 Tax=Thiorhodococcus mannitoliphagus TaxID=329406 RepID=A0A6P1DQX5_9GAMM|nr:universal stress protein [Thiorhodococcus mannitoliphagus]NEX19940.1 universal stress protein [Thiorhodococcus mannitoliphagus]
MRQPTNILYFADGVFGPTRALGRAIDLARRHRAKLTLMDVTIETGIGAELIKRYGLDDDIQQSEQRYTALSQLASDSIAELPPPRLRVTIGHPFIEVIQAVLRDGHDLVIKPARQLQGAGRLFGSNDMHLLRKCPCPVWIDRETERGELSPDSVRPSACHRVVAAVDPIEPGTEALNARILDTAAAIAEQDGAELHLVHAWQSPFPYAGPADTDPTPAGPSLAEAFGHIERVHRDAMDALIATAGAVGCNGHLVRGAPAAAIIACANALDADLLVMSTLSRLREPGLFIGTTAEDILQTAMLSVLALKPEGFISPVGLG